MSEDDLLKLLPRLDCGLCGYRGCKSYADAVLSQEATIDRCAPGGPVVLEKLALLTKQSSAVYLPDMDKRTLTPQTASIEPSECIGCYKCAEICPVDAVIGAQGKLHEILATECNGCGVCLAACPVDCIQLVPSESSFEERYALKDHYAMRQHQKSTRLLEECSQKNNHYFRWKQTGGIGKQRRISYIQKAQKRVFGKKLNEQKCTTDAGAFEEGLSRCEN